MIHQAKYLVLFSWAEVELKILDPIQELFFSYSEENKFIINIKIYGKEKQQLGKIGDTLIHSFPPITPLRYRESRSVEVAKSKHLTFSFPLVY